MSKSLPGRPTRRRPGRRDYELVDTTPSILTINTYLYLHTTARHSITAILLNTHQPQKNPSRTKHTNLMATTPCLPVPNATVPFWRTDLDPLDSHRSTEELPSHCDILVIGAGYAGASTVHHILKQQTSPLKILLLEAREACSGASGRNGKYL